MMIESSVTGDLAGAMFPAIFYDGEREIDLGSILITPFMNFKSFQSLISHKIGISPHQITTYFTPIVHQSHHHHHQRQRRHPVTNKFNFAAAISAAGSALFWVVLKRSRRVRRRNRRPITAEHPPPQPSPFVLLRRDEVQEVERYLMSLNLNSHVYSDLRGNFVNNNNNWNDDGSYYEMGSSEDCGSSSGGSSSVIVFCEVCWNAKIEGDGTVPFHWCKNDAVTMGFKSHAGPIGPPVKKKYPPLTF